MSEAKPTDDYEALRSATENAMAAYAELAEVKAGNALLREALRLACEDGWDDGQWAMRRYIEMAQASLSDSPQDDRCPHGFPSDDWDRCRHRPDLRRHGSPARVALRHALEQVYAGEQTVETDAVLDQLDTLGYRLVER